MSDYSWMEEVIRKRPGGNTGSSFWLAIKTLSLMRGVKYMNTYFIIGVVFMLLQAASTWILSMIREDYRNMVDTITVGSALCQLLASALLWPVVLALNVLYVILVIKNEL